MGSNPTALAKFWWRSSMVECRKMHIAYVLTAIFFACQAVEAGSIPAAITTMGVYPSGLRNTLCMCFVKNTNSNLM